MVSAREKMRESHKYESILCCFKLINVQEHLTFSPPGPESPLSPFWGTLQAAPLINRIENS